MPSLSAAKAFNAKFSPAYLPVAVFFGGTSGIGRGIVEAFARYTKGNAHIVIVGRNETAAESIIATLPKPSTETGWKHEFVACEASLMKNITVVTSGLLERFPKINFLVISSGYVSLRGRNETEEGIDHQLAVRYYGRWKMISDLLPSLRAANNAGEASKVLSVLDTDNGMPVDLTDLGLKLKYSGVTAVRSSLTYTDMAFEVSFPSFARRDYT
jgi:NAD(P)-dependent dehydrogenase (short-subunit alcohol dehydrogenase family)